MRGAAIDTPPPDSPSDSLVMVDGDDTEEAGDLLLVSGARERAAPQPQQQGVSRFLATSFSAMARGLAALVAEEDEAEVGQQPRTAQQAPPPRRAPAVERKERTPAPAPAPPPAKPP
eukprot:Hpha_TRINITY_DN2389_c0_g1::TRINITY_DN2389_c0_g1_i1::g.308::m.308